jgi:hypothetical protein
VSVIYTRIRVKNTLVCVCGNHTLRVKSHSACINNTRACRNHTRECHIHTRSRIRLKITLVCEITLCRWKLHFAWKNHPCACWNHTRACCNHIRAWQVHTVCGKNTFCVKKSHSASENNTLRVEIAFRINFDIVLSIIKNKNFEKSHLACINSTQTCRNHIRECQIHTHTFQNYSRVCKNHTLRVIITLCV